MKKQMIIGWCCLLIFTGIIGVSEVHALNSSGHQILYDASETLLEIVCGLPGEFNPVGEAATVEVADRAVEEEMSDLIGEVSNDDGVPVIVGITYMNMGSTLSIKGDDISLPADIESPSVQVVTSSGGVPEPSTLILLGLGILGALGITRKRIRQKGK